MPSGTGANDNSGFSDWISFEGNVYGRNGQRVPMSPEPQVNLTPPEPPRNTPDPFEEIGDIMENAVSNRPWMIEHLDGYTYHWRTTPDDGFEYQFPDMNLVRFNEQLPTEQIRSIFRNVIETRRQQTMQQTRRSERSSLRANIDRLNSVYNRYIDDISPHGRPSPTPQQRRSEQEKVEWQKRMDENRGKNVDKLNRMNNLLPAKERLTMICDFCEVGINGNKKNSSIVYNDSVICMGCVSNHFRHCEYCDQNTLISHIVKTVFGEKICSKCIPTRKLLKCSSCDRFGPKEEVKKFTSGEFEGRIVCTACAKNSEILALPLGYSRREINNAGGIIFREYTKSKIAALCSPQAGSIIRSNRIFSAELECVYPDLRTANAVFNELPRALGIGSDNSIEGKGVEIRTPKLQGEKGERFLMTLCEKLLENGFETNKTCGFHTHIDAVDFLPDNEDGDFQGDSIRNLFAFYLVFEDTILSFLPRSRRKNEYCKSIRNEYRLSEILSSTNLEELEKAWYKTSYKQHVESSKQANHHNTRYAGANFHSLLSDGHLEIRYHSGTIQAMKVLEWINLHVQIMDKIHSGLITRAKVIEAQEETDTETKTEIFFELLDLPMRAKKYFLSRQQKFKVREKLEEDSLKLK